MLHRVLVLVPFSELTFSSSQRSMLLDMTKLDPLHKSAVLVLEPKIYLYMLQQYFLEDVSSLVLSPDIEKVLNFIIKTLKSLEFSAD